METNTIVITKLNYENPPPFKTKEEALATVSESGLNLQFLPRELITAEVVMAAVTNCGGGVCNMFRRT